MDAVIAELLGLAKRVHQPTDRILYAPWEMLGGVERDAMTKAPQ